MLAPWLRMINRTSSSGIRARETEQEDEVWRREEDEVWRREEDEVWRREEDEVWRREEDEVWRREEDEVWRREEDEVTVVLLHCYGANGKDWPSEAQLWWYVSVCNGEAGVVCTCSWLPYVHIAKILLTSSSSPLSNHTSAGSIRSIYRNTMK